MNTIQRTTEVPTIQRSFALLVGIVFLIIGILGFIPFIVPGGKLFGLFAVNTLHNIVHLIVGVLGIAAAYSTLPRLYNQVLGIVYVILGILGFIPALIVGGKLFSILSINVADNILHLVVGILALYIGFFVVSRRRGAYA